MSILLFNLKDYPDIKTLNFSIFKNGNAWNFRTFYFFLIVLEKPKPTGILKLYEIHEYIYF